MEKQVLNKSFLVVGCGGLGCYIVEELIRLNAKSITVCDGDCFDESNLNRQLYATQKTVGKKKVLSAKKRAKKLGFKGKLIARDVFFNKDNANSLLDGIDIVIDALDNIPARLLLEDVCEAKALPIVHGAVAEWNYQIGISMPGFRLLHKLYEGKELAPSKTYSFAVAIAASREVSEAVKLAEGKKSNLENKLLIADLEENIEQIVEL